MRVHDRKGGRLLSKFMAVNYNAKRREKLPPSEMREKLEYMIKLLYSHCLEIFKVKQVERWADPTEASA